MIKYEGSITIVDSGNSRIETVTNNIGGNNISADINTITNQTAKKTNPFILGSSKLGYGKTLEESVDFFIGKQLSDTNGNFKTTYVITITGTNLSSITFVFDSVNNGYPKNVVIDGETFSNNSYIFVATDLSGQTHTVQISEWNTENMPLRIEAIYVGVKVDINRKNLLELQRNLNSMSDISNPSFGITSNSSTIKLRDLNGEIKSYIEQGLLNRTTKILLYLVDTIEKSSALILESVNNDYEYDDYNFTVNIETSDNILQLQNFFLTNKVIKAKTAYSTVIKELFSNTNIKFSGYADIYTNQFLNACIIKETFTYSGSVWNVLNQLLISAGCICFEQNGRVKILKVQ